MQNLATPDSDFSAMASRYQMIADILSGTTIVRRKAKTYLPKFEGETDTSYQVRLSVGVVDNFFENGVRNIAARPFNQGVSIEDSDDDVIVNRDFNDVLYQMFYTAVCYGESFIFCDFPRLDTALNLQEMNESKVKPYSVVIPNANMLAVSEDTDEITYIRYSRTVAERVGHIIQSKTQIVVQTIGTIDIYEKNGNSDWQCVDTVQTGLDCIPIIRFQTGIDQSNERPRPPLLDAAYKQIEHYQVSAGLRYIMDMSAYPMLAGQGMDDPMTPIPTGAGAVLYAPQGARWELLEPESTSMVFIQERLLEIERVIAFLCLQPLISASGNTPAMLAQIQADRALTAIGEWAVKLQFVGAELASLYGKWLGKDLNVIVKLDTSFGMSASDVQESTLLLQAFKDGGLSQQQLLEGLSQRNLT